MNWGVASLPSPAAPVFGVSLAEIHADAMENHAKANSYFGPPKAGASLAGWPLDELAKQIPGLSPADQLLAMVTLKKRYANLGAHLSPHLPNIFPTAYSLEERLAMRMNWGRVAESMWAPGFEHVVIHSTTVNTIVRVWVITKDGQSVVLEDEAPLFPSDALITKLNMMKQE